MTLLPLIVYAGILVFSDGISHLFTKLVLGWILLLCAYGIVVIHNNLSDLEIDKMNHRVDNPLTTGVLSREDALRAQMVSFAIGSMAALLINVYALIWLAVYIFLGWLYSGVFGFKNKRYLAIVILGISYGVMPWMLGYIALPSTYDSRLIIAAFASFLYVAGIIILKDIKDIRGDKVHKKMTLLVVKGWSFTRRFMLMLTSAGYLVCCICAAIYNHWMLWFLGIFLLLLNVYVLSKRKLFTSSSYRGKYGSALRILFFCYALGVWAVMKW